MLCKRLDGVVISVVKYGRSISVGQGQSFEPSELTAKPTMLPFKLQKISVLGTSEDALFSERAAPVPVDVSIGPEIVVPVPVGHPDSFLTELFKAELLCQPKMVQD